jgi:hypothetical protein
MCFQSFCQAFDPKHLRREENISVDVIFTSGEKYLGHRATGFLVGDLQGAISGKVPLPP